MAEQDEVKEKGTPQEIAKFWQEQIDLAKKDHKDWVEDGKKVVQRYKRGREKDQKKRTNILYSNTETMFSALYGKPPKPDVRRRYGSDPDGQAVAELLEKVLEWCADEYDADAHISQGLQDYLLPGRGVVRIEYEPVFGNADDKEYITHQKVRECYVYWEDFLCMPARTWADIQKNGWISFRHTMDREELVANFGDIAYDAPLNWQPDIAERNVPDSLKKAEVYEIWDVTDRTRTWIVEGFDKPLRVDEDPYQLRDFFPLAEPPSVYKTTDTIIPEPEFHVYKDQADDLDENTNRISRLTRALKRRGVYDSSVKELARLANAGDNVFIPCENYQNLASRGGLAKAFESEDISLIANVLLQLHQQRDLLVQSIWETVGIADIMRGSSQASETLGAQELKAQFGSQRMKRRQRAVQKWLRDLLRLKAEIIAEHFEPEVLQQITGMQVTPQMMQILREDKLRSYRIDIETDSTIFEDAEAEKKARSDMIQSITVFVQGWGPVVQAQPSLGPLAFELLKFGLEPFKSQKSIDEAVEMGAQMLAQAAQQPKPPSPEEIKAQAETQKIQLESQMKEQEAQHKAAESQANMAMKEREAQMSFAMKQREMQLRQQEMEMEFAHKERMLQLKEREAMLSFGVKQQTAQLDLATQAQRTELEHESMEHEHKLGMESMEHKHDMGMEMMSEKAKQAKNKPGTGARE